MLGRQIRVFVLRFEFRASPSGSENQRCDHEDQTRPDDQVPGAGDGRLSPKRDNVPQRRELRVPAAVDEVLTSKNKLLCFRSAESDPRGGGRRDRHPSIQQDHGVVHRGTDRDESHPRKPPVLAGECEDHDVRGDDEAERHDAERTRYELTAQLQCRSHNHEPWPAQTRGLQVRKRTAARQADREPNDDNNRECQHKGGVSSRRIITPPFRGGVDGGTSLGSLRRGPSCRAHHDQPPREAQRPERRRHG